ncbi:T cell receptor alpha chain MC.7.G5-like [Colius striatus]|uniref:T cell receptor alpha chain MC.7.G5-like n=1 Tax=Colius striatus TaxID=57412 RepID=UPI002B1D6699|nr:T cell receptor alpha chain MC.7.G5-like [Colius striatus]
MRWGRGAGLAALLLVAAGRAQVQQEPWAETTEDTAITINCSHPDIKLTEFINWYRQFPGRGPEWLVSGHKGSQELRSPLGRLSVSADRRSSGLRLSRPRRGDAAVYWAIRARREDVGIADKLMFGSGTTLTVEPNNVSHSDPQVIVMKSKKLEEDGNTRKAACLARKYHTKNIILKVSSSEVIYEQNTPVLTSEGLYDTIMVVNATKDTEVSCTAKYDGRDITANETLPEKEAEESVTQNVCNTTDTSAQDAEGEKTNMLSMAVLGLRVLLAKSVAFNTLMSIKLFLF